MPPTIARNAIAEAPDASSALKRTRDLLATVFAATNEAIIVADPLARIVSVNPAFTRITGLTAEEVIGRNPHLWSSDRHSPDFYERMWSDLHGSGQWQGEIWNRRKNGEVYPAWQNISAVRDDAGNVTCYVSIFADISDLKSTQARLTHLAHHDMLTGLANRSLFTANLDAALERAKRHHKHLGMLVLGLDRFKLINDTMGHAAGDRTLQAIGQRLRHCVRAEDTVARLGGDEFGVLVEDLSDACDAAAIASKILAAVSEPIGIDGREVRTSTSIGIGLYPDDARSGADLVKAADAAMYRAKARGRQTYDFYTADLSARAAEYLALESGLRRALANGELELHYQPQADVASGRIVGVEALLRWRDPQRGLLLPDQFIHIAEDSGLIERIDEWVLNSALAQAVQWKRAGVPLQRLAVNVSGREVMHGRLADTVAAAIARHRWRDCGMRLELELTESVLLPLEHGASVFQRLKEAGAMIAIDDFGTGYSSLSRLQHLPVDTLKIDRSFVHGLPAGDDSRALATAIIAMGHGLGLRVIAEGVETPAQLQLLASLGCDEVQGYAVSAPVPAEAIAELVHAAGTVTA